MASSGKWLRNSFIWLLLALAIVLIIVFFFRPSSDTLSVGNGTLTLTRGQDQTKEVATINDSFDVTKVLSDAHIDYSNTRYLVLQYEPPGALGAWLNILGGLIPFLLIGGLLIFMMRQAQGSNNQALSFG